MYLTILILYIALLLGVSYITSRGDNSNNRAFFSANHNSPWWIVAFGMIGATLSGISVVSVPGMVSYSSWTYLQTCIGFFFGYLAVAYILLPIYYKLKLTSIYEYLNQRFGSKSHRTGSLLFVVAKLISSATKLYIAVVVLQQFIFKELGIPFWAIVIGSVAVIWLYTHRSGMRTIIWTDTLQTLFFIAAIGLMSYEAYKLLGTGIGETLTLLSESHFTHTFEFKDFSTTQNFYKQFISGIFIVIVMTGLDQDMMQKNLTCRTLRESQRNMLSYGIAFIPVNLLLLVLGALMLLYVQRSGIDAPSAPDALLPYFASNIMSPVAGILFVLGIISASFSSADSALTSITTTLSIDIIKSEERSNPQKTRRITHLGICILFTLIVIAFGFTQNKSIIDTIYTIVSYTYGPLLGLFGFGIITKLQPREKLVPYIALASPIICWAINHITLTQWGYKFGYELLMLNGLITFTMLYIASINNKKQ